MGYLIKILCAGKKLSSLIGLLALEGWGASSSMTPLQKVNVRKFVQMSILCVGGSHLIVNSPSISAIAVSFQLL